MAQGGAVALKLGWGRGWGQMFHCDYDTRIYETCLTEKISDYYTWATIGL